MLKHSNEPHDKEDDGEIGHIHVVDEVAEQIEISRQLGGAVLRRTFLILFWLLFVQLLFFPGFEFAVAVRKLNTGSVTGRSLNGV